MDYEVIVVGGGIGGLTVAAVLAARGVNVCLLERQSQVGGCAAPVAHGGYQFDPTFGLYTGWGPGEVYDRLCHELGVSAPRADLQSPAYVTRLPDGIDIPRVSDQEEFESSLRNAFPECPQAAIDFYRHLGSANRSQKSMAEYRDGCSSRFHAFVDVQLQAIAQASLDTCSCEFAAGVLDPLRRFWRIQGGIQSLIELLAESFRRNGGRLRLDTPVLRLAYGSNDLPVGVDLLNGERVVATRAVVSNLTVWDTYGKLVGPNRTPRPSLAALREMHAYGVYQTFLTLTPRGAKTASPLLIAAPVNAGDSNLEPEQLIFCPNALATSAESDHATAVVSAFTSAEDWFSFHEDHGAFEARDQAMLEKVWSRLHGAMPELGEGIEIIETASPQTFYETVRRRFGMIGRPTPSLNRMTGATVYPNLWIAGDTVAGGAGIEGVVDSSWQLARRIIA